MRGPTIRTLTSYLALSALFVGAVSAQDPSDEAAAQLSGCYTVKVLEWELRDWEHRGIELPSLPATLRLRTRPLGFSGVRSRSSAHYSSSQTVRRRAIARDYAGLPVNGFDSWWTNHPRSFAVGTVGGVPWVRLFASLDDEDGLTATAIYLPPEFQLSLGRPTADFPTAVLDFVRTPCATGAPPPIPTFPPIRHP